MIGFERLVGVLVREHRIFIGKQFVQRDVRAKIKFAMRVYKSIVRRVPSVSTPRISTRR